MERFALAGVSGGAPYVAACAHRMPQRVRIAGIVSGVGPLDDPSVAAAFSAVQRRAFGVLGQAPRAVRSLAALPARLVRR